MCGIAGLITDRFREADTVQRVHRMIAAIRHRGPDGSSVAAIRDNSHRSVVFGHARLSILDLKETSSQPMRDFATSSWLVYNGEIYNFRELRHELETYGYQFLSTGDTEVVLKAMVHWKREALRKFEGMFAIAFWDGLDRELILARDTFGIKPLLFTRNSAGFAFASELKSIEASELAPFPVNRRAITTYLTYGCVVEPETAASNVSSLPPGQMLIVDAEGRIEAPRKFGTVTDLLKRDASPLSTTGCRADVEHALRESVKKHLVSDVPIGISLSGGIDSSLLALIASEQDHPDLRTLTVSFPDEQFSELEYALRVVKRIRAKSEIVHLDDHRVLGLVLEALAAADQPTVDGVNTYIVSKAAASAGIRVLLTGLGGDEIFGGYTTFNRVPMLSRHHSLMTPTGRTGARMFRDSPSWLKWHKLGEFYDADNVRDAYLLYRSIRWRGLPLHPVEDWPPANFWVAPETMQELTDAYDRSDFLQIAYLETSFYMRNQLLRDADIFGSANSIELRVPYLHIPLIQLAWSLGSKEHISWRTQKNVLRSALRSYDPSFNRPQKMGFTLPWDRWLRTILRSHITDVIMSAEGYNDLGLSQEWAASLLRGFEAGNPAVTWMHVWSVVALLAWYRSRTRIATRIGPAAAVTA